MYHRKLLSVAVPISSDKNISSDEDKDVRRGIVNSNTNNIVYQSTESSYELPFKDKPSDHDLAHDHEQINNEVTISTLLLLVVKHHQKKRKVVPQTDCWDILLKAKRRYNS